VIDLVKREYENTRKTPDGNRLLGGFILCRDLPPLFFTGDRPLVFELNRRPLALHHHRPRQPAHVQRKVVSAAAEDIRRGRSGVQRL